ncbi:MAG: hypothetical protein LBQ37_04985 [Elusimicrobiota bacterium]|jgi:hypothetical protein|nr:hypothetical protein [Elusimicrobiota bacterium]
MLKKFSLAVMFLGVAILISSCASAGKNRATQSALLNNLQGGKYEAALNTVNAPDFYSKKDANGNETSNSALLGYLERGTVLYLSGNYEQALETFNLAQQTSDDLFTKSISKKVAAAVGSSSVDNYYGSRYERSLIRFYQALVNYNLSQKATTPDAKTEHLRQARANITEWSSLLDSYKTELAGKVTFKTDLAQNLFGAFIHEQFGTSEDRQIALNLYPTAKNVLFQNYNLYPSFNDKYVLFNKDFKKLSTMNLAKVESDYVGKTSNQTDLEAFIDARLAKLQSNNKDNVFVVVKDDFVAPKIAKKVIVGFIAGNNRPIDIKAEDTFIPVPVDFLIALGGQDFYDFLNTTFKLGAYSLPTIEFEIPYVAQNKSRHYTAELVGQNETINVPLALADPISDFAANENELDFAAITPIAVKAVTLHTAALYASYQIYKKATANLGNSIADKTKKKVALTAFGAAYVVATKAINSTLQADLRYWSTLPNSIRFASAKVADGAYTLNIYDDTNDGVKNLVYKQKVEVKGDTLVDINTNMKAPVELLPAIPQGAVKPLALPRNAIDTIKKAAAAGSK